jgi:ABC-type amino acid transport substrate-binding protein
VLTPFLAPSRLHADLAEVRAAGRLRVLAAVDDDPAWFSLRAGESPGFEREVLEGFARLQKLRFEVVPIARWEDAIPMLLRRDGDVLGGMSATAERRQRVDFSAELLPVRVVVVTRRPAPPTRAMKVADIAAAVEAIRVGHADATVSGAVDFFLQRRRNPGLEAGMPIGEAQSSAWAVRKGSPELRQALDAYLVQLRRSPNWSRLLIKYFGDDAPAVLGGALP